MSDTKPLLTDYQRGIVQHVLRVNRKLKIATIVVASLEADLHRGPWIGDLDQTDPDDRVEIYTRRVDYTEKVSARLARASDYRRAALFARLDSRPFLGPGGLVMDRAEAERALRLYVAEGDTPFAPRMIAAAFGADTPANALLRARDAIQNPVVSSAERDRLRALFQLCVDALKRQHHGQITSMAQSVGLSRPTYYRAIDGAGLAL